MIKAMIMVFLASVINIFINLYLFDFSSREAALVFIFWNLGAFAGILNFKEINNLK